MSGVVLFVCLKLGVFLSINLYFNCFIYLTDKNVFVKFVTVGNSINNIFDF